MELALVICHCLLSHQRLLVEGFDDVIYNIYSIIRSWTSGYETFSRQWFCQLAMFNHYMDALVKKLFCPYSFHIFRRSKWSLETTYDFPLVPKSGHWRWLVSSKKVATCFEGASCIPLRFAAQSFADATKSVQEKIRVLRGDHLCKQQMTPHAFQKQKK